MTRKQAIDAAQDWAWAQDKSGNGLDHNDVARLSATHAYDLGRVAGMREAAKIRILGGTKAAYILRWDAVKDLRNAANALARELRRRPDERRD